MTKEQIIDETVAFYSEDVSRRAVVERPESPLGAVCEYLTDDGRMCAVGRCLLTPAHVDGTVRGVWGGDRELNEDLKPEYRGHEIAFWRDLQFLHDRGEHWDETGLSRCGHDRVDLLKEMYA